MVIASPQTRITLPTGATSAFLRSTQPPGRNVKVNQIFLFLFFFLHMRMRLGYLNQHQVSGCQLRLAIAPLNPSP